MKGGREEIYINQSKFRAFRHATQHLNFLHLKTKLGALIGIHKGYKSIAKMLALHIPHKKKEINISPAIPRLITSFPSQRETQKNNFLQA